MALPVATLHDSPSVDRLSARSVTTAAAGSALYLSFSGACIDFSSSAFIRLLL
jgi:hypothetical protein